MTAFGTAALGMGMNTLPAEAAQISGITSSQLVVSAEKATATDAEKSDADSKDKNADEISDESASDKKELSGWVYNQAYEGYAYYKDNSPVRGWNTIDGRKYFFDTNGILMEGFQTIGTTLYYLGSFDSDAALAADEQGVDDGVTRNRYLGLIDILFQQVLAAESCRSKVICCNAARYLPVHFFRPRAVYVICAKSSFHVSYWYLLVKSRQSGSGRCRCVAMNEHNVGLYLLQHIAHSCQHACCYIVQILPLAHDIQVIVWLDVEDAKHLVKHLTVLPCHTNHSLETIGTRLQSFHQRCHLYCFRPSAEHKHYCLHSENAFYFVSDSNSSRASCRASIYPCPNLWSGSI